MKVNQVKQFVASNISRFEKLESTTARSFNLYDKNNLFRGEFNFTPMHRSDYLGIKSSLSSIRIMDENQKLQMQEFVHLNKDYVTIKDKTTDTLTKALPNKIVTIRTVIDYVKNKFITIQTTSELKNKLQRIAENDPDFISSDRFVIYEPISEKPQYEKSVKVLREGDISDVKVNPFSSKIGVPFIYW